MVLKYSADKLRHISLLFLSGSLLFCRSFVSPCSLHPSWRCFSFSSISFSFSSTAYEAESDTSYPASARLSSAKINVNHASSASDQDNRSRSRTSNSLPVFPDASQGVCLICSGLALARWSVVWYHREGQPRELVPASKAISVRWSCLADNERAGRLSSYISSFGPSSSELER
jgi:hypothetical protein